MEFDSKLSSHINAQEDLAKINVGHQITAHISNDLQSSSLFHVDDHNQSLVIIIGKGVRLAQDDDLLGKKETEANTDESDHQSIASRVLSMYQRSDEPAHVLSELVGSWALFLYHRGECLAARGSDGAQDLFFTVGAADGGQIICFSNSLDHLNFQEGNIQSLRPGHYCLSGRMKRISTYQFALSPDEIDERMRMDEARNLSDSDDEDLQMPAGSSSTPSRLSGTSGPVGGILRNLSLKIKETLSLSPPGK